MTLAGHALAVALYLFAAVYGWRPGRVDARGRGVPWILAAGAALHTLGLFGMHLETPPVPLQSVPAAVSLIGWLVAVVAMAGIRDRMRKANVPHGLEGPGITLIIAGIMALAFMGFSGIINI